MKKYVCTPHFSAEKKKNNQNNNNKKNSPRGIEAAEVKIQQKKNEKDDK